MMMHGITVMLRKVTMIHAVAETIERKDACDGESDPACPHRYNISVYDDIPSFNDPPQMG